MELSIVIPVYNSEAILPKLIEEIKKNTSFLKKFELILVNDQSTDNSWDVIVDLKKRNKFIVGINLMRNFSQHNSIMAGLQYCKGNVIIIMDDDLQHDPGDIVNIYNKIAIEKNDVCYAVFQKRNHKWWKLLGSKLNDLVANILIKKPKGVYMSPYKGFSKLIKDIVIMYNGPYPYVDGLILTSTNRISMIKSEHRKRNEGKSNYTLFKSISLWVKMATGFSVLPLRFATYSGIVVSLFSFLFGLIILIRKLSGNTDPQGWTSLIVVILFISGVQLLAIGLLGEYIGRTYIKSNQKPQYLIREKV